MPALMHATLVPRPHRPGWVYEETVDAADGQERLISLNGRDHTRRFPELVKALGDHSATGAS